MKQFVSQTRNKFLIGTGSLLTAAFAGVLFYVFPANAEIQCPTGWVKEVHDSAVVCVAQNQNQNQNQVQNNNQNQNVNQNVNARGGSSSSSSSSSSNSNININNPSTAPSASPTTIVITQPRIVYQARTVATELPRTGLPEAALAVSGLLPLGLALKKFGPKNKRSADDSAHSIWLKKQSR